MKRLSTILASSMLAALLMILSNGMAFAATSPGHLRPTTFLKAQHTVQANIHATSCSASPSDSNCTGQDPVAQGCNSDAITVQGGVALITDPNNGVTFGEVDLRFSPTCQSNWARTILYRSAPSVRITAEVTRQTDGVSETEILSSNTNTTVFSNMVFAPVAKAQACGTLDFSDLGGNIISNCTPFI